MDPRAAEKALINGALEHFAIPGDANFPLNQAFEAPNDRMQAEQLRGYLGQVRQELAMRLHQRLYENGTGPSKVCSAQPGIHLSAGFDATNAL
jgi:actin related protein 2/3 complex, subunit 3